MFSTLIDTNQQVVASYRYDEFGNLMKKTGTLNQPFQFSTKRYDEQTGLSYYGYRFYNSAIGRWMTRDPLGEAGGINLYGFVGNNPVNLTDPLGLAPGDWWDLPANFQRAQEIAKQELQNRPSGHDDAEDAMRHAIWNSRMVHETNTFTAWVAGVGHEIDGLLNGQSWGAAMMDLHNNAGGRAAGGHSPINPNDLRTSPTTGSQYNPYDRGCQK